MWPLISMLTRHPLSGFFGIPSIFRFLKWQIHSRVVRRGLIHNWIGNSKFFVSNGETGLTGNIYVGLHEFRDMGFLLHFLRPQDFFIDIGSNSGSYTILASGVVGAKTLAIEPVPETFKRLLANIRLNELNELVLAKNIGISSKQGTLQVTVNSDTTNHLVFAETGEDTVSVNVNSLDEVCVGFSPILLKIDVEGWESEVLKGARKTLSNVNLCAVILEINGNGERLGVDDQFLLDYLGSFDFAPYSYDPISRRLTQISGRNFQGGNTIFIRDSERVSDRIEMACRRKVLGKYF